MGFYGGFVGGFFGVVYEIPLLWIRRLGNAVAPSGGRGRFCVWFCFFLSDVCNATRGTAVQGSLMVLVLSLPI